MLIYKERYLNYKKTYTSQAAERYDVWLRKFETIIGDKAEGEVTLEDVFNFKSELEKHHSPKSIEYAMVILKNYFSFLRLDGIQVVNPKLIRCPKGRANSHQHVSSEYFHQIVSYVKKALTNGTEKYLKTLLIIRILAETGVRVGELISLTLDNIDPIKSGALINNKKNQNKRWIYWSDETNKLLQKYLEKRKCFSTTNRSLFLAQTPGPQGISSRTVQRIIKECCKGSGITGIVPHSFRHGMAHAVLEKGGTVADVQKMLGHKSAMSSMKYLQLSDLEHERRAKMFLAS